MQRELTAQRLRELLFYNADTGFWTRLHSRRRKDLIGLSAGCIQKTGYVGIHVEGRLYLSHRLAWLYMTGSWPTHQVDHVNGVRCDNRWCNLRDVPKALNMQNIRNAPRGKKHSDLLGAHWCSQMGRWKSSIKVHGRRIYLGVFDSDADASEAYLAAKRKLHLTCSI